MNTAGYSGTPLLKKLGIKAGYKLFLVNYPVNYFDLLGDLPENVSMLDDEHEKADFIHFFTKEKAELEKALPELIKVLKPTGMLWVSWPKKASKIPTDVDAALVRELGLQTNILVDTKICAVDEVWSGHKFMIRKDKR